MGKIRVMIVDDSPFSRTILSEMLKEAGYEVAGEADSIDTLIDIYHACKPHIVTMDLAMPGADGFECSKALLAADPAAKIILVSSMKDEDLEAEARRTGIAGYVQKPVDAEAFLRVIHNILSPDTLFDKLNTLAAGIFKEALQQSITRMTKTAIDFNGSETAGIQHISQGITVVIGIIGRNSGSMILDLSEETAKQLAKAILRREAKDHDELLTMAAEFANVIAGVACSLLNKTEKAFGLRVAPPSVFYGAPTEVVSPNLTVIGFFAKTDYGKLYLSIGFKKGATLWM